MEHIHLNVSLKNSKKENILYRTASRFKPFHKEKKSYSPLVKVFLRGWRLLKLVTLLLSALRSTGGGKLAGVSLWDRSCIGTLLPDPTLLGAPGLGSKPLECNANPGTGSGGAQCLG